MDIETARCIVECDNRLTEAQKTLHWVKDIMSRDGHIGGTTCIASNLKNSILSALGWKEFDLAESISEHIKQRLEVRVAMLEKELEELTNV